MGTIAYTIPTIGTTSDPTWESYLNTALTAIQTHTHDGASAGALILPAAIDFTSTGFNFGNQPQSNASYFDVAQQSVAPAKTAGHGRVYCDTSGNLYYVSPSTYVLLASATSINYSSAAKGFLGDYGTTGGACYFNTASTSWPNNSTFYFYTSTSTPSDDTGSRAGLGAAFLLLKAAAAAATVRTVDSASVSPEDFRWGFQATSSSRGEYGLNIFPDKANTGTVAAGYAFNARETPASVSLSPPSGVPAAARTYQFCIGDAVTSGAVAERALAVRKNVVNVSTAATYPLGYHYLAPVDGTGAAIAAATGFGMQWEWRLPGAINLSASTASLVAAYQEILWANYAAKRSQFRYRLMSANTPTFVTPLDMLVNSAGSVNVGLGGAASIYSSGPDITCYMDLNVNGYNILGVTSLGAITGNITTGNFGTCLVGSGGLTVGSGGDSQFVTGTFSGLLNANGGVVTTAVDTSSTLVAVSNTVRNARNNICAWAKVTAGGSVSRNVNVTGISHTNGTGIYVLTLNNNVDTNAGVIVTGNDANDKIIKGAVTGAAQVTVTTQTEGGALADTGFTVMVLGGA